MTASPFCTASSHRTPTAAGVIGTIGVVSMLAVGCRATDEPRLATVDTVVASNAVVLDVVDGDTEIAFDPGTQPGEVRVLRGRGMPVLQGFGRGDIRVLVNVTVPRRLTDEQRRLLQDFEQHSDAETYAPDEGFLGKIKSAFR